MKKLILMAIVLVTLATTVNAATWTCTDNKYSDEVLVTIELEDMMPAEATITVRGKKIAAGIAGMEGLNLVIYFGPNDNYKINIKPNNYAGYYNFTGVSEGVSIKPSAVYYCKQK